MKHLFSFLAIPAQKKNFLVHETLAQFLSAFLILSARNALCIAVYMYLPAPFLAFQPRLNSGIRSQIGGQDCTLRVGGLLWLIEGFAHSLKLVSCLTQAKGSSWLLTNVYPLLQCGSAIV